LCRTAQFLTVVGAAITQSAIERHRQCGAHRQNESTEESAPVSFVGHLSEICVTAAFDLLEIQLLHLVLKHSGVFVTGIGRDCAGSSGWSGRWQ
jgi:hypothetical protein